MEASSMNGVVFKHNNTVPPKEQKILPRFQLTGKTAVVTGAGTGIGLSVAQGLAEAGANVAIWYKDNDRALTRAEEIAKEYGVKCQAYKCDIRDTAHVETTMDQIVKDFNGRLDVFVANAGIPWVKGAMIDGPVDHYREVLGTCIDGTYYCARAAGRHWRRQKKEMTTLDGKPLKIFNYGSFIATASMSAHIVNIPQMQVPYNTAKSGVIALCRSLAVEWVTFARANTVSPGYTATKLVSFVPDNIRDGWLEKVPMGRQASPYELKGIYLYLASDAACFTTGVDIPVDGGYTAI